jgi:hypothetical protein
MEDYIKIYSKLYSNREEIYPTNLNIINFYYYIKSFDYQKIIKYCKSVLWFDEDSCNILISGLLKYKSRYSIKSRYLILETSNVRISLEFYNIDNEFLLKIIISDNDFFSFVIENNYEEMILDFNQ